MVSAKILGMALTLLGLVGGISYAYLILYMDSKIALLILRVTAAITAILLGSLIAGTGIALLIGWREFEEAKRRQKLEEFGG